MINMRRAQILMKSNLLDSLTLLDTSGNVCAQGAPAHACRLAFHGGDQVTLTGREMRVIRGVEINLYPAGKVMYF